MSKTYSPKRFTNIGLLRKLSFPLLIRLLETHRAYFEAQPNFKWAEFPERRRRSIMVENVIPIF